MWHNDLSDADKAPSGINAVGKGFLVRSPDLHGLTFSVAADSGGVCLALGG